jgi:hypothetical protein
VRASPERKRIAAKIAITKRWHPDSPELAELRRLLDESRVADLARWAQAAAANLPASAEIVNADREARRTLGAADRGAVA